MPVAVMHISLRMEFARSLKDRRQVVRSLRDRLRHGFNVSVAEMDEAATWQSAVLGVAAISASRDYLTGQMAQVEAALASAAAGLGAEVAECWWSFVDDFVD